MNLRQAFEKGQQGKNVGLPTGLEMLDRDADGIQKEAIYCIAAGPKVGKSKLVDKVFVLSPYILSPTKKKKWFYFSYEMTRVQKEFNFIAYFMFYDYGIQSFEYDGDVYPMSARYLQGRLTRKIWQNGEQIDEMIPVSEDHREKLLSIYQERIIPLFGEYDDRGVRLQEGLIEFMETRDNPTGMRNTVIDYCNRNGEFLFEEYVYKNENGAEAKGRKIIGWLPQDPDTHVIIITDHMRKLKRERGYNMKENIDKWTEYQVELRNWCRFTFVDIIHLNRSISNIERLTFQPEFLHPTGDDVKDTGNLSEEVDYMFTLFNPTDEKYNIKKHFGLEIIDGSGNEIYQNYRSLHLVESRSTESPLHFFLEMNGAISDFKEIKTDK